MSLMNDSQSSPDFSTMSPDVSPVFPGFSPSPATGEAQRRAAAGAAEAALAVAAGEALREAEHGGRWGKKNMVYSGFDGNL